MPLKGDTGLLPAVSLPDLAEIVLRRRRSILLILLASVIGTMGYVIFIRGDSYVAEARLLVRLGQEQAPAPTTIADRGMMVGSQGGYASGELELLSSRDLIGSLVDRVDLTDKPRPPPDSLYGWVKEQARQAWTATKETFDNLLIMAGIKPYLSPREQAIEAFAKALSVESPPLSNLVIARVIWPQRGAPELLLKNLLELYFSHRSTIYQGATAAGFFQEQRNEAARRLTDAETALSKFERENGISSPDEQRNALLKRLGEAESGVDSARVEMEQAEMSLRQFNSARDEGELELAMFAVSNFGSTLQQSLASQLSAAAAKWLSAQSTLSAQDQNVRRLRTELTAISSMLVQQLQAAVAQKREALKLRETLRDNIRNELQGLQASLAHWQELRRAVISGNRAYELYDGKLNEARGIAALEQARIGNVVVVQQPAESATPLGVRKSTMLLLSLVGGALLAAIWVTVREFFDHRLHGPADIERRLALRSFGEIPLDVRGLARGRALREDTRAGLARAAVAVARSLSASAGKAILVTGSEAGEGTTVVTAHLGAHLVRFLGLRVLLVDMGGAPPTLSKVVRSLDPPPEAVKPGPPPEPAAGPDASPTWAIVSIVGPTGAGGVTAAAARLVELLDSRRAAYDVILIDAPPVSTSVAGLLAARAGSHALLICSADRLSYETIERACKDLTEERVPVLGAILNRYQRQLPRWLETALR
jgi:uncharacterized protein involved in exopolysaccharide biosynthesis/Mrp family chromosome partitioning ATPase